MSQEEKLVISCKTGQQDARDPAVGQTQKTREEEREHFCVCDPCRPLGRVTLSSCLLPDPLLSLQTTIDITSYPFGWLMVVFIYPIAVVIWTQIQRRQSAGLISVKAQEDD